MPQVVLYGCAAILLIGTAPLPYGFYMLLRLVACGTFIWASITAHSRKMRVLMWVFALTALLFNPVFKIHLQKHEWAVIDIAAGLLLLITAKRLRQMM